MFRHPPSPERPMGLGPVFGLSALSVSAISLSGISLSILGSVLLGAMPLRAEEAKTERKPETGYELYTSYISEVDACNRAQKLRPADSVVTRMHYWREGDPGERRVTCRIDWSEADDAKPTFRPILFGRSA